MATVPVKDSAGVTKYKLTTNDGSTTDLAFGEVSMSYPHAVASGLVDGATSVTRLGERETMAVEVAGEDVWRGNELTPAGSAIIPTPSSSGEQMSVVSESANDTAAGTGVQQIEIHYIKASDGLEYEETISLNGTTAVDFVVSDIKHINDFYAVAVGSGGVAAGHIKIFKKTDTTAIYDMIAIGGNRSMVLNYMVPAGKRLIMHTWHASEAKGKRVAYRLRSTDMHGILREGTFIFKDVSYLNKNSSGDLDVYYVIPASSIIKITAWSDANDGEGSAAWHGILEDI